MVTRYIATPRTEKEWDQWVRQHGKQFPHCYWLATNHPARRKAAR